jgi:SAM-dependent methyltransferase
VGGGASRLVDRLLDEGFSNVTVVDISEQALTRARERLGARAGRATWLQADARYLRLPRPVDVWHDRAVFHFLTDPQDQAAYVGALSAALRPAGYAVMATFALDGPRKCSGLEVARYSPETLAQTLGPSFRPLRSTQRLHLTPAGSTQAFTYCLLQKVED